LRPPACLDAGDCAAHEIFIPPAARSDLLFTMSENPHVASATRENRYFRTNLAVGLQSRWWSQTGSNRRPPACKAGALPAELWPRSAERRQHRAGGASIDRVVGLGRLELPTSRLSSARSNQLSYKPKIQDLLRDPTWRNGRRGARSCGHPRVKMPLRPRRAHGAGSSKKKEKRRRRCPANGHLRPEPQCPDVSKRSDSDCVMQPLKDHP
jgi:hypothetical protein